MVPRGDGGENGLSSGTSGPIASRDDGAIFVTAAKNLPRICAPGVPLHLGMVPPRNGGHDLFPTPGSEG